MNTIKNILLALLGGLVFLGAMLIGTQANAQSWDGTHIYAPQYTKHFKQSRHYAIQDNGSEGGSEGFLITRSAQGMHFTLGYMQNSYGEFSHYGMFGLSIRETNKSQLSFHFGLANNYSKAYYSRKVKRVLYRILPYSMHSRDILPMATFTYKHRITKSVGVQFNINPAFVNSGVYVQL